MSRLTRRIARAAALTAVPLAATLALVAPAAAAPVEDSWENCTDPIEGAVLCLTATPDPASGTAQVTGSLTIESGRTFAYGLMYLFRCPVSDTALECEDTGPLIQRDTAQLVTAPLQLDDDYYYWVSANWRDDQWHTRVGVRVTSPEPVEEPQS
jgi:hypothetical protein